MKTLRMCGLLIIAVLMCAGFTACSDDDDETDGAPTTSTTSVLTSENLVGTWTNTLKEEFEGGKLVYSSEKSSEWICTMVKSGVYELRKESSYYELTVKDGQCGVKKFYEDPYEGLQEEGDTYVMLSCSKGKLVIDEKDSKGKIKRHHFVKK